MKPSWQIEWDRDVPGRARRWWQFRCRHRREDLQLWPGDIYESGIWPVRYECRACGRVRHDSMGVVT